MAFVIKFFKTVRNNWKKSVVFTGLAIYGVHYGKGIYEDDMLRRQYCAEARKYGEVPIKFGEKARKVTVFLNPAASRGGGKRLFEKNAAPLLYLAGLEVNVIKTEYEGQIKEYMKVIEQKNADALIVAGGNVSVLELVTGMMRKEDQSFRKKTPIGVIPVGSTNKFATFFYGPEKSDVRRSLDAAMSIIKCLTKRVDVLKFQGDEGNATFALCGMESGAYRDAKERTSKYWYFGPLKHRFTYIRSTLSRWPPTTKGSIKYTLLTEDNAHTKPKAVPVPAEQPKQAWSWRNLLFGGNRQAKKVTVDEAEEQEYDFGEGDDIIQEEIDVAEFNINSGFTKDDQKLRGLELELGPSVLKKLEFISHGWSRMKEPNWKTGMESNNTFLVKKVTFIPEVPEGQEKWFNIDGEQFEAKPITVTFLKDRLNMFQPVVENS